jgi:hypothetical protein
MGDILVQKIQILEKITQGSMTNIDGKKIDVAIIKTKEKICPKCWN